MREKKTYISFYILYIYVSFYILYILIYNILSFLQKKIKKSIDIKKVLWYIVFSQEKKENKKNKNFLKKYLTIKKYYVILYMTTKDSTK